MIATEGSHTRLNEGSLEIQVQDIPKELNDKFGGQYMSQQLSKEAFKYLNAIAEILLRCFIITVLALVFVWVMVFLRGDYFYQIQTIFVDISRREFDLFILYSLTFIKALNVVFFLFPFIAIKLFLYQQNNSINH